MDVVDGLARAPHAAVEQAIPEAGEQVEQLDAGMGAVQVGRVLVEEKVLGEVEPAGWGDQMILRAARTVRPTGHGH